jgi:hypothetical protein
LSQQFADAGLGDGQQIFKGEHQVADRERQLGIFFLDAFENGFAEFVISSRFITSATPRNPA